MSPNPLTRAQIEAQARLRKVLVQALRTIWNDLPGHDRENLDEWLSRVLPAVETTQRASAELTAAYIARSLGKVPLGIDPERVIGTAVRNGTPPAEVYERPFVTLWGGLASGLSWEAAASKALARAEGTAAMDVQLSQRAMSEAAETPNGAAYGYTRTADAGACAFCEEVNGAYVKAIDGYAFALHNGCGCTLEPNPEPHRLAVYLPDGQQVRPYQHGPLNDHVAVENHGELGPVLVAPGHKFTSESDI